MAIRTSTPSPRPRSKERYNSDMVSFDDYFSMPDDEIGNRRAAAAMAITDTLTQQIQMANLPGMKPENFFLIPQIRERTGHIPKCFPIYSSEDPIINLGLLTFAQTWSGTVIFGGSS